jgi:transcriptional regulator with XRE-family HTH domain
MARDPKSYFGHALREARERLGISQEELSARSGVSVDSISRAERSVAVPGWEAILELSKALAVTPTDFAPRAVEDAKRHLEAQSELLHLAKKMSIAEVHKVLEQARLIAARRK